ncbi:PQQ-binding-like beta-propeller repeat protein [Streptomyces sp. NPDC048290]|uniref:outer membrane protein assembly factor BamB family protein n=1 Tax=Streptomyces sp. NPDC048290 TaxID=3155811 RepID=UPI0034420C24
MGVRTGAEPSYHGDGGAGRWQWVRVAVPALCLALLAGLWAWWPDGPHTPATAPGPTARPVVGWQVAATGGRYDEGPGAWGVGDTVVQGRRDGLFAYAAGDGAVLWTVTPPRHATVCAMSPGVVQGVGLVAFGRRGRPCATLVAVRAADGTEVWRRTLTGGGLVTGGLAVGGATGSTVVTAEPEAVRARSAETGAQRWWRGVPDDCAPRALGADTDRTLLVEQCGTRARLIALDTRTGGQRWVRALPVGTPEVTAAVVSATPAVLALSEEDPRGTRAYLGFDGRGRRTATVPLSGPGGELVAPDGVWAGTGAESPPLVVGDLLVALVRRAALVPDCVVAYSLTTGREVWEHRPRGLTTSALAREPDGRIGVLAATPGGGALIVLLGTDGAEQGRVAPQDTGTAALSIRPQLLPVTEGHVVVNHLSMSGEPGVFSLR